MIRNPEDIHPTMLGQLREAGFDATEEHLGGNIYGQLIRMGNRHALVTEDEEAPNSIDRYVLGFYNGDPDVLGAMGDTEPTRIEYGLDLFAVLRIVGEEVNRG